MHEVFGFVIIFFLIWYFLRDSLRTNSAPAPRQYQRKPRTRKKKDLYRKLAPSYIRAYDRLIAYIQARGGAIKSREDGRQRLAEIWGVPESDVGQFFDSPYVIKALGFEEKAKSSEDIEGDEWWEKGYSSDEGVASDSPDLKPVVELGPASAPSASEPGSGETCGEAGCSTAVTAFDFRCFSCRKRFCEAHGGKGVDCQKCSGK